MSRKHANTLFLLSALALPTLAAAQGFIEDSSLNLLSRNVYWDHDGHKGAADKREWGQGFQLAYSSGYTRGTVGFGLEAHAYAAFKLDSQRDRADTGLLVPDSDGSSRGEASTAGAALKLRVSGTELKYGELRPYNPVLALADARLIPATATGFLLSSQDIPGIDLEAGHFTAARDFNRTHHDGGFRAAYAGVEGGDVDFIGASHSLRPNLGVTLYASRYEDLWRQYYLNGNYDIELDGGRGLNLDFNLYRSLDQGRALAGDIQVTAWSLAAAYRFGAHKLTLAHQRIHGDQPFDYLGLGGGGFHDSIYLANSSQYADFNGPNERSWRIRYDLDLSTLGVPGLSFMARYIRGSDIDGGTLRAGTPYAYYGDDEKHWERDIEARYVVQAGKAKDLTFHLRQATHRISGQSDVDVDQLRLIVSWPLRIL
ncbi:OprD family porin [Stutzerimonas kirkiae]|uniref:Outer membrane porin, OprD family n=1 Tax=Stutzerimonas kirkiae TaxID=2211392 RepID=A0A4Q9RF02_9GAMM|nr:OprD family porin [Stutzerimonas kirkiae]TBU99230.1 outer membrane porin, OprD family [Stutzerimonas kirkiae]TBV06310.1 outer membrane porin, OprD family [Stutzerimonas kirkiae]TBV08054.1 outer membrane porin, OprD family [Stutzerimonas kirkiae]TBV15799.1 outer membrane porin, OprD family [Stutzerimonas kirkiae]